MFHGSAKHGAGLENRKQKQRNMKTNVLFAIGLMVSALAFAGNKTSKPLETTNHAGGANSLPVFTGTTNADAETPGKSPFLIYSYLRENVEYPKVALKYNIQGTEVVRFTVDATGKVGNITVVNSVCPEIDNEIVRVLKTTNGMWEPGLENGQPVEMEREIAMAFRLNNHVKSTNSNVLRKQATLLYNKGNKILLTDKNPEKAIRYFNRALNYLPAESAILQARGIARYLLNDKDGAQADWDRVAFLTAKIGLTENPQSFTQNTTHFQNN